jgi:cysteine desulfurase
MQVYLDNNATSPLHPEVVEAMLPFITEPVANPSSMHEMGRFARSAIEAARDQVAGYFGAAANQVIFTSGGSEANNLMLKGQVDQNDPRPLVSSLIEHPSILEPLLQLEKNGRKVHRLTVDENGVINLPNAKKCIVNHDPQLVSVMLVNNETGAIQPVGSLFDEVDRSKCIINNPVMC